MLGVAAYLLARDPALLARRLNMKEKQPQQALIQKLGALCYLAIYIVPAFDRRFGWSSMPGEAALAADGVVLVGYVLFVRVLMENRYASRVIAVETDQQVVTTGPYRLVRHPMYLAIIVMYLATPLALGSWWGLVPALLLPLPIAARIVGEERLLARELTGYTAYMRRTRYRLIPALW
jgi:protein-S-isoprenylcysteine O-methyltransferase Ste14